MYVKATKALILFLTVYLLYGTFKLWYADTLFAKGQRSLDAGNPGRAYNLLTLASDINKAEPFYKSELAYAAAQAAAALEETDSTLSAQLKNEAVNRLNEVLSESPRNVSYLRTAVRTYFELSVLDPVFLDKTIESLDKAILLAPTDPKLYYNKALVLSAADRKEEEITLLQKALKLKPNYPEVQAALKEATASQRP